MKQSLALLILFIILFNSCKKEEVESVDTNASIQVINQLNQDIDILYLHAISSELGIPINDSLFFKQTGLPVNDTSSLYNSSAIEYKVGISVVINFITYTEYWECPNPVLDPSSPQLRQLMPAGNYIFTLSELDTVNQTFLINMSN